MADPGAQKKFNEAYRLYAKDLYRYLYFMCGDQSVSEDLMQDSFVRFWKHCHKIESQKVKPYLFKIAKNLLINHQGKQQVFIDFKRKQKQGIEKNTPQFELEKQEFKNRLDQAISKLNPGQREVFLLNRIEGLKYREIADLLGISQKAVEKRMSQALKELRKIHNKI